MMPVVLVGGLRPFVEKDFPIRAGSLGFIVGLFFASSAAGSWLSGRALARHKPARAIRLSVAACSVLALIVAIGSNHWLHLAVWFGIAGAVNGALQPSANQLLLDAIDPERIGRALGFKQSSVPLGMILVGLSIPTVASNVGWRWAVGLVPVLAILVTAATSGRQPTNHAATELRTRSTSDHLALWMIGVGAGCGAGASVATTSFFVSTAGERGVTLDTAGLALTTIGVLNASVLLASGILADRHPNIVHPKSLSVMLGTGVLGYLLGTLSDSGAGLIVGAILAVAVGHGWHVLLHLNAVNGRLGDPRAVTGSVMAGVFAGCSAVPMAYGAILSNWGDRIGWAALTATAILGSAAFASATARVRNQKIA